MLSKILTNIIGKKCISRNSILYILFTSMLILVVLITNKKFVVLRIPRKIYVFYEETSSSLSSSLSAETNKLVATYKSNCECKQNDQVSLEELPNNNNNNNNNNSEPQYGVYLTQNNLKTHLYTLPKSQFTRSHFQCNMYASLRRGPHQKVFGFSLYGTKRFYYEKLANVSAQIKALYPQWLMRVYHNASLNSSILCELECESDNIDFCDVNSDVINANAINVNKYVLPMAWRWFPIGDRFVDVFGSRDSDSFVLKREADSVKVWLESGKLGHIMRDHPWHDVVILGGMWGLRVEKNRDLSESFFGKILDSNIMKHFNPGNTGPKGHDQQFLGQHVYPSIRGDSIIHDSYLCKVFKDSDPFPTQRVGDCYIGSTAGCNVTGKYKDCPIECRPKDHQDWIDC